MRDCSLSYSRIIAPISGRIGLRLVDAGNIVHANDPNGLVVITQLQPITVVFTIPEDSLPPVIEKLKSGESLPVEAYDREQKRRLATGALVTVDNQIDPTTGTVRLKAVFDNADNTLFPNQFVNARLLLDVKRGTTIVPTAAMQRGPKGTFVYVVKDDQTVAVRPVKLGPSEVDDASIESGVAPGDLVVVDGTEKLREGTKVELVVRASARRRVGCRSQGRRHDSERAPGFAKGQADVNPSRLFILRPVATALLMVAILLAGIVAYRQLPVSALAAGRLSDHPGPDVLSRRQPGCHGVVRHGSARAAVRPDARPEADDFDQFRRQLGHHAAIRLWI